MTVKAAIFDIDGTLVDSVDLHARAWQEAFQHFGYTLPFAKIRHEIGKGSDKLIPDLLGQQGAREVFDRLDKFRSQLWKRKYFDQVKPFPDVRELFERVRCDGIRVVLASSAKGEDLKKYKQIAEIEDLVEEEASSDDIDESKPAPDAIEAALNKLSGTEPGDAVMVGDTPWDILACRRAGVRGVGVLCGGFPEQELRQAGAIAIYRDPSDLLKNYDRFLLGAEGAEAA